jgi:endonuclease YncB( thermonuclease family)
VQAARSRRALGALTAALGVAAVWAVASLADAPQGAAGSYQARAVHIHDGDSLIVSDGERQRDLRIAEIDTPERGQPWGKRATQALRRLVEGKALRVELVTTDRYGREVSKLWADGVCVACELVRAGDAWAYREYLRDSGLLELERKAREGRLGLWGQPAQTLIPPWEWRQGVRVVSAEAAALTLLAPAKPVPDAVYRCASKRHCREMSSCAEARFYLEQCGLTRLDRDGDGVACEDLCF